ncbi:MAG: hypothetical protein LQ352_004542 [Teloschistes flavicans]|nr:MAG: hypothetical protein LQ352_004542 [Teloschistes flavicans]
MPSFRPLLFSFVSENVVVLALCLGIAWVVYGAIWRLYFSPLAAFPGPRFAALTYWNEFYYDVVLKGQYTWKILDYHHHYGPIIRINPNELHINDPDFFNVLYVRDSTRKSDKWWWSMRMFGHNDLAVFDTLDHEMHRVRRQPWNPYFSKQSVARLHPLLIQPLVNKFCDRLTSYQAAAKPVIMTHAFGDLTADIISEYSFPQGYNNLDHPEFRGKDYDALMALSGLSHWLKQFGWLFPLLNSIPLWLTKKTSPDTYSFVQREQNLIRQATEIIATYNGPIERKESTARPDLMHAFLDSNLPPSEKTVEHIKASAQTTIAAGTLTTTHSLVIATYHILANPPILRKLVEEIRTFAKSDGEDMQQLCLDLPTLEHMPYLTAIWYETLRVFSGISQRSQRIFPFDSLAYHASLPDDPTNAKEYIIPPGTPVGMTGLHIHMNSHIFPDPHTFKPERWLPLESEGGKLLNYLVAFGAGSRSCIGRDLAKAEVLTTIATVFGRFGANMQLYETDRERDVDIKHDYFNPAPSGNSNGMMVTFHER